jgi:6-phosphofructokinase 2
MSSPVKSFAAVNLPIILVAEGSMWRERFTNWGEKRPRIGFVEVIPDRSFSSCSNRSRFPIEQATRENLTVFEQSSGRQFRFGMPGARVAESNIQTLLDAVRAILPPVDYLVLSGSLPPGAPEDIYSRAAEAVPKSCRVILDTSGPALRRTLSSTVFLIKPNLRELGQIAGRPIESEAQIREVARSIIDTGKVEVIVTSLGAGGAMLITAAECAHIRAPMAPIRSRVGAGDSTVAGIVHGLSEGLSILEAVRFGVAAGSASVMTEGTELCRRADTERLYREMIGNPNQA